MNKFISLIEEKLLPTANKIASNDILNAIRNSMMSLAPFFIIGSIFLLLAYFPLDIYQIFINELFGENVFKNTITSISNATINVMGLFVLLTISYNYAIIKNTDIIYTIICSLMSFLIITPMNNGIFPMEWFSAKGMFISIILSITITNIYIKSKNLGIAPKMPDSVPPAVSKAFSALIPILIIAIFSLTIRIIFSLTEFNDIHNFIFISIQKPLLSLGNNLFSLIITEIIGQTLWFFGLHGNDIIGSVMSPIWLAQNEANLQAFINNQELPNIITTQMRNTYMLMGGSGNTLPLILCLIFFTKSTHLKKLSSLALPASIFNINEPLIFGIPIVLNPILFIPFILNTPISAIITYFSMKFGLVNLANGILIPWTTPVFISGYLVSGFSGVVLQLVLILIGFLIYYPFIKILDNNLLKEENINSNIINTNDDIDLSNFKF